MQFRRGTVQLTAWPRDLADDAVVEIWALVAFALPSRPEIADLVAQCNEAFSYGRLLRQEDRLGYRDVLHASPLSESALNLAIQVGADTALRYGPMLAQLGAVDGTAADPTPPGPPSRPPDARGDPPTGGYL